MTRKLILTAVLAAGLGLPGAVASGQSGPQHLAGSVTLAISKLMSQAELRQLLLQNGYTDIQLSPVPPNTYNVRPDIQWNSPSSARLYNLAETPVRNGWNGTAVKDGRRLNINVTMNTGAGNVAER